MNWVLKKCQVEIPSSDHKRIRWTFGPFRCINKHFRLQNICSDVLWTLGGPEILERKVSVQSKLQLRPAPGPETRLSSHTWTFSRSRLACGSRGFQYGVNRFIHFHNSLGWPLFHPSEDRLDALYADSIRNNRHCVLSLWFVSFDLISSFFF